MEEKAHLFLFPSRHLTIPLLCPEPDPNNSLWLQTSLDTYPETIFLCLYAGKALFFVSVSTVPPGFEDILTALSQWFPKFQNLLILLKMVENFKQSLCYLSLLILEIKTRKYLFILK